MKKILVALIAILNVQFVYAGDSLGTIPIYSDSSVYVSVFSTPSLVPVVFKTPNPDVRKFYKGVYVKSQNLSILSEQNINCKTHELRSLYARDVEGMKVLSGAQPWYKISDPVDSKIFDVVCNATAYEDK